VPASDPSNPVSAAAIDRIPKSVISVQQDLRRLAAEATAVHELLFGVFAPVGGVFPVSVYRGHGAVGSRVSGRPVAPGQE